jgi:hypothetical protein
MRYDDFSFHASTFELVWAEIVIMVSCCAEDKAHGL